MKRKSSSRRLKAVKRPVGRAKAHSANNKADTPARSKEFPVVGIGASAGGFESFTKFLGELPADSGMAFVLVQHLDPKHESHLTELLARSTSLPVIEIKQGTLVRSNHVYVIPPNHNITIRGSALRLVPRPALEIPPMPVDFFLRSLAENRGRNAVGVIFSGNGSDGTLGMEAIKGSDGITFAQDPRTAKFPGMPASAIASGCVDVVLPPERMARELAKISRHPFIESAPEEKVSKEARENGSPLNKVYSLLRSASGVDFSQYKQSTLNRRIARRMVITRIENMEDYARHLQGHSSEVKALFDDVLITVTRFFRDPRSFQVLVKKVFPALIKRRPPEVPIRIWVPACSSGEEVYSIAISLAEFLGDDATTYPVQIFGTDISDNAVAKARAGLYRGNIALDVSAQRLNRYFTSSDDGYRINRSIRDMCVFARQNLCADPPFSDLDLISCQNVLIYFGPELQRHCIPVFHYALKRRGFLLLGAAESISGLSQLFTQVDKRQRLYVKSSPLAQPDVKFNVKRHVEEFERESPVDLPQPPVLPNVERAADRLLLHQYTPCGVILDHKLHVLQFRGRTAPYFEHAPGAASLNLLKMVSDNLAVALRSAINRALKTKQPVRGSVPWAASRDGQQRLGIEVVPFKAPPAKEPFLMVLFNEGASSETADPVAPAKRRRPVRDGQSHDGAEVGPLREELNATRERLQAVIEEQEGANEELKSANEEIQSSNEELQSTNEELETAKEELQSTNEELATVNEELRHSNLEATRVNNDLINLLGSVQIPVVMVDNSLILRRFTPSAQKYFNLIASDIGRSLSDIKVNLDVPDLDQMILNVIETLHLREVEVRDRSGHWYALRIRPYRTKDNKIEGAVLALLDVDELKRNLDELTQVLWDPFIALDSGLRVSRVNDAFCDTFRLARADVEGRHIYEQGDGAWNIPRLRTLLEQMLPEKKSVHAFPIEIDFPSVGRRSLLLHARRVEASDDQPRMIIIAIQDVTDGNTRSETRRKGSRRQSTARS